MKQLALTSRQALALSRPCGRAPEVLAAEFAAETVIDARLALRSILTVNR